MFAGSINLKWFKRLKVYKNSTNSVSYDPSTKTGRSYRWEFLQVVDGLLVFNNYNWSSTTNGHQSAVRSVLRERGTKIDIIADFGSIEPRSISKQTTRDLYKRFFDLEIEIDCARQKDSWAQKRRIENHADLLKTIETLETKLAKRCKISKKEILEIKNKAVEDAMNDLSDKLADKTHLFLSMREANNNFNEISL
jgi:hypothetical protein